MTYGLLHRYLEWKESQPAHSLLSPPVGRLFDLGSGRGEDVLQIVSLGWDWKLRYSARVESFTDIFIGRKLTHGTELGSILRILQLASATSVLRIALPAIG